METCYTGDSCECTGAGYTGNSCKLGKWRLVILVTVVSHVSGDWLYW